MAVAHAYYKQAPRGWGGGWVNEKGRAPLCGRQRRQRNLRRAARASRHPLLPQTHLSCGPQGIAPADVVILLSPEFNVGYAREFLAAAKPRMAVVFIHEPSMPLE